MKTYYVYHLNCDCQSEDRIYDYQPKWAIGPKCQGCKTILEDSQVSFLGKFKTTNRQEALKEANKKAMDECHKLIDKLKNNKMKTTKEIIVEVNEWDKTVQETYGRPYSFQQQDGCKDRGIFRISIPDEADDFERETVPEIVNHDTMGVSFDAWMKRDTKQPLKNENSQHSLMLWWERNFYPNIQMIANDLCKKGVIEKGNYIIEIDW